MRYLISPEADKDLDEIWLHIAQDHEPAADKMILKIFDAVDQLVRMPLIGRGRSELHSLVRSYAVTPYVIFYIPTESVIQIVRILHGARDIEEILH